MGELIVGGTRHACAAQVVSWFVSGMHTPGTLRESADLIVLDWTGTDARAAEAFKAMRGRRDRRTGQPEPVGAHVHIDHTGIAFQWSDALAKIQTGIDRFAARRSVTVLFSNRCDANVSVRGVLRERMIETTNEETTAYTTLTAAQMRAGLAVVTTLCGALSIPLEVPMDGTRVRDRVLGQEAMLNFSGVVGAFHLKATKHGPGLAIMRAIAAKHLRGRNGAAE